MAAPGTRGGKAASGKSEAGKSEAGKSEAERSGAVTTGMGKSGGREVGTGGDPPAKPARTPRRVEAVAPQPLVGGTAPPTTAEAKAAAAKVTRAPGASRRDLGLTLRVDLGPEAALGPGKVRLLEGIAATGSISAAGRDMGMSYRRAWLLVDAVNRIFGAPVVATRHGGKAGGGAGLTPLGEEIVRRYRDIEAKAAAAAANEVKALGRLVETAREAKAE